MKRFSMSVAVAGLLAVVGAGSAEAITVDLGALPDRSPVTQSGVVFDLNQTQHYVDFSTAAAGDVGITLTVTGILNSSGTPVEPEGTLVYTLTGPDPRSGTQELYASGTYNSDGGRIAPIEFVGLAKGTYELTLSTFSFDPDDADQRMTGTVTGLLVTPLPAAGWFLLSGLGGLAAVRRWKTRSSGAVAA
jgi:hypothetical protein